MGKAKEVGTPARSLPLESPPEQPQDGQRFSYGVLGKVKEVRTPARSLPRESPPEQPQDGQRFSFSRLFIKLTGRAFLFTVAWLAIAFRAVVYSPKEPWVGHALIIAGCVTGINIMGDKLVDALATAIGNAKINLGSSRPMGYGGVPLL
jgi:hypothetical protein